MILLTTLVVLAIVGVLVWWFVFRKKTTPAVTPVATSANYSIVPSTASYQTQTYDSPSMGYSATVPGIIETEQKLMAMNRKPRMIPDLMPRSAQYQATNIRGEIPIPPRKDHGTFRPLNAELDSESRFINGHINGYSSGDYGYKNIVFENNSE